MGLNFYDHHDFQKNQGGYEIIRHTVSNQIRVVAFNVPQLTQTSFLQKNQTLQNVFFDICNAEMAQSLSSLKKSEFLKLIISFFHYFWCQN
jgi:hypothetical protein